jgi:hypothetical protein
MEYFLLTAVRKIRVADRTEQEYRKKSIFHLPEQRFLLPGKEFQVPYLRSVQILQSGRRHHCFRFPKDSGEAENLLSVYTENMR